MNDDQSHSVDREAPPARTVGRAARARSWSAPPATLLPDGVRGSCCGHPTSVLQAPAAVAYKEWPLAPLARARRGARRARPPGGADGCTFAGRPRDRRLDPSSASPRDRVLGAAGKLDLDQVGTLLRGPRSTSAATPRSPTWRPRARPRSWRCSGRSTRATSGRGRRTRRSTFPMSRTRSCSASAPSPCCRERRPCVPCDRAGCEDRNDSASVCLQTMAPARVIAEVDRLTRPDRGDLNGRSERELVLPWLHASATDRAMFATV